MTSKSYDWVLREIFKISAKVTKKQNTLFVFNYFNIFGLFNFLKNCPYDSNEIFYGLSTPYKGLICAISSKSYDWVLREIFKISPKVTKKQNTHFVFNYFNIFGLFNFLKNSPYDSNEIFYGLSTPYKGLICAISSKFYDWVLREIFKISPKVTKKQNTHFVFNYFNIFGLFNFLKNCPYDSNEIFYGLSTPYKGLICAISSKSYDWVLREIFKISPKVTKKQNTHFVFNYFNIFGLFNFLKNCPYDSNEIFYGLSTPYKGLICAISSKSYDWDSSESEGKRPNPTPVSHMWLWFKKHLCTFSGETQKAALAL